MINEASIQNPLEDRKVKLNANGWVVKAVILPYEVNYNAIGVLQEKLPDIAFRQYQAPDNDLLYSKRGLQIAIPLSRYDVEKMQKIKEIIDNLMKKIDDAIENSYYLSMQKKKKE